MDQLPSKRTSSGADTPGDEEIARRVRNGEVELFELLMRRNNQRVYRAVRGVLSDEADVEDAMQQAYVSAYLNLAQFQGASRFSTWLVRIALNEALAHLRRAKKFDALDGGLEEEDATMNGRRRSAASPEHIASDHEILGLMERAIDALPELYRTVFMLRDVEGLSTAECAEALDASEDVVKTRLRRAKAMLRERLTSMMDLEAKEVFTFHDRRCDRLVAPRDGADHSAVAFGRVLVGCLEGSEDQVARDTLVEVPTVNDVDC